MIAINDEELAVGSRYKIKLYNRSTDKCTKTFSGHEGGIQDLCLGENNNHLFSGSLDKTIKIWDIEKGICLKTFTGHGSYVRKVIMFSPGILCSASDDSDIKLWNISKGTCIQTLSKHQGWVYWISKINDGSLVSAGKDVLKGFECMYPLKCSKA